MLMNNPETLQIIEYLLLDQKLIAAVFSGSIDNTEQSVTRVTIKPVRVRGKKLYQFESHHSNKTTHQNLEITEAMSVISKLIPHSFKQVQLFTSEADIHILVKSLTTLSVVKKPPSRSIGSISHNRNKSRIMPEFLPNALLEQLGIMSLDGKVIAAEYHKFRQINRFLEIASDVCGALPGDRVVQIVDFGCGKSYLTFALYYYLHIYKSLEVQITGIDLKKDVIEHCSLLAKNLGYQHLHFECTNINTFVSKSTNVDMVVSLHACDTATDEALIKAIEWNASIILAVPCCQHELYSQLNNPLMIPLTKHGIIRERLASLITDAARANLLEIHNYSVQLIEFIDSEHTPKNILIRAVRNIHASQSAKLIREEYDNFRRFWQIHPFLEKSLAARDTDSKE